MGDGRRMVRDTAHDARSVGMPDIEVDAGRFNGRHAASAGAGVGNEKGEGHVARRAVFR